MDSDIFTPVLTDDKLFLIYQLMVISEADRLDIIDHEEYRNMIAKILKSFTK